MGGGGGLELILKNINIFGLGNFGKYAIIGKKIKMLKILLKGWGDILPLDLGYHLLI